MKLAHGIFADKAFRSQINRPLVDGLRCLSEHLENGLLLTEIWSKTKCLPLSLQISSGSHWAVPDSLIRRTKPQTLANGSGA